MAFTADNDFSLAVFPNSIPARLLFRKYVHRFNTIRNPYFDSKLWGFNVTYLGFVHNNGYPYKILDISILTIEKIVIKELHLCCEII